MDTLLWLGGIFVWCVIWGVPVIFCGIVLREVFWSLWNKKLFKRASIWRFGLPLTLLATATVAAICSLAEPIAGPDDNWDLIDCPWLYIAVACILWALYLARLFITDVLENFGLIKPRVDIHRFLQKRPDTGSEDQFVMPDGIDDGIDDEPSPDVGKKKKRRRWWTARKWRTRVQEIRRLFPHRRSIGRDEF